MNHGITDRTGMEDSVRVDVDQIVEILLVLAGHDIACAVGIREGIQKSLQTALQKLDEWILGLVFAATTENAVFQDVRDTRRVRGRGAEGDAKYLVVVITGDRKQLGAALLVLVEGGVGTVLGNHILGNHLEGGMSDVHGLLELLGGNGTLLKRRDGRGTAGRTAEVTPTEEGWGASSWRAAGSSGGRRSSGSVSPCRLGPGADGSK